ncbi:type II toxin-antitoxin system RelB/DinJ family antitoxin [Candidatus Saccharibacteria bacterium]|nr:type II toxin-antitoxin system RelB/DinJ family antitoxin [Candidatus Saccharibacteria bacterium]
MATTDIHIRIDTEVKEQAEQVLKELGLTISDLVNMTMRKTIKEGGVPFEAKLAKAERSLPENMNIQTKAELEKLLNESIENDTGIRYSIDDVKTHIKEREKEFKESRKIRAAMIQEVSTL